MKKIIIEKTTDLVERMLDYLSQSFNVRGAQIISQRYGLNGESREKLTLDAVGKMNGGISRERVRQIEKHGFNILKQFPFSSDDISLIGEIKKIIESLGSVVDEEILLREFSSNVFVQNQISFCLLIHPHFHFLAGDDDHVSCWSINNTIASMISKALQDTYISLEEEVVLPEERMLEVFSVFIEDQSQTQNKDNLLRWLSISKRLSKNSLNEWGLSDSPLIKPRGLADYAYIALDKTGKQLHFSEIPLKIKKIMDKEADTATCHNAIIMDDRFVLVGRGLYALKKWGYKKGSIFDTIKATLKESAGGMMTKDEIIKHVKKVRFVKDSSIIAAISSNMQFFMETKKGYIKLRE